jgi:hypothetical protein
MRWRPMVLVVGVGVGCKIVLTGGTYGCSWDRLWMRYKYAPFSFGLSTTSQQHFYLRTIQPPVTSQQYFSRRTNQHHPSATSQTNRLMTSARESCINENMLF